MEERDYYLLKIIPELFLIDSLKSQTSPETPAFRLKLETIFSRLRGRNSDGDVLLTGSKVSQPPTKLTSIGCHGNSRYIYSLTIGALLHIAKLLFQSPHSSSTRHAKLYFQIFIIRRSL
jgi:hypothetical protein